MSKEIVLKNKWEISYENKDNFVFYPHEEIIRFISKYVRKRVGLDKFVNISPKSNSKRVLDVGCGIGRHVIYCYEMGLESYGVDLSDSAIEFAIDWAKNIGMINSSSRILQSDIRKLAWSDDYFEYAISHGVFDSMPFDIAKQACLELGRVMKKGGFFYCDLISGDDSLHSREYSEEEVVSTEHEEGTIQSYFNMSKIYKMIEGVFSIEECWLIRKENILDGGFGSRYHLILKNIKD